MVAASAMQFFLEKYKTTLGFCSQILVSALIMNVALGFFHPGFVGQPIAHTDGLWNALGMYLAGFGCILLGGCPMRQLILSEKEIQTLLLQCLV